MATTGDQTSDEFFDFDIHEQATELMAMWLARFRAGDPCSDEAPNQNDVLMAGILTGALMAKGLLVAT